MKYLKLIYHVPLYLIIYSFYVLTNPIKFLIYQGWLVLVYREKKRTGKKFSANIKDDKQKNIMRKNAEILYRRSLPINFIFWIQEINKYQVPTSEELIAAAEKRQEKGNAKIELIKHKINESNQEKEPVAAGSKRIKTRNGRKRKRS